MWAVDDTEKVRLLLEAGADANARSDDGRTPLMVAEGRHGSSAVVKLLLDHGADPSAKSPYIFGPRTPLSEAACAGDADVVRILIERGADAKQAGYLALFYAAKSNCAGCFDLLAKSSDRGNLTAAAAMIAPPLGDARPVRLMLERGADPNGKDQEGNPLLLLAAASDELPVDTIRSLLDRGAVVNAKGAEGKTALDLAKQRGATQVVDLLIKAGGKESDPTAQSPINPQPAGSVHGAVEKSLELVGGSGPEHPLGASGFLCSRLDQESHEVALFANPLYAHVAFKVSTLAELRSFHARVVEKQVPIKFAFNHGVSFAFYFDDPDGNTIEIYWPTGALESYRQPHAEPLDLTQPDDVLLQQVARASA